MNHQFKPINAPPDDGGVHIHTRRALRTTANVIGWASLLGFIVPAAPFLLLLFIGSLFVVRSCHRAMPPTAVTSPATPRSVIPPSSARQPAFTPPVRSPRPTRTVSSPLPTSPSPPGPPAGASRTYAAATPAIPDLQDSEAWRQQREQMLNGSNVPVSRRRSMAEAAYEFGRDIHSWSPFGVVPLLPPLSDRSNQHDGWGFGRTNPFHSSGSSGPAAGRPYLQGQREMLRSMLTDPGSPAHFDFNGAFDNVSGRTFVGASQLPNEPSTRVELSIDQIRDRGSHLTARLKRIEGTRKILHLSGMIEDQPPRLVLIPKRGPRKMGSGSFGTPQPWYGSSPSRITLFIDDGKSLSGQSQAGESFELLPKEPRQTEVTVVTSPLRAMVNGDQLRWEVTHRNQQPLAGNEEWFFTHTARLAGDFTWTADGVEKAEGRYLIPPGSASFILDLEQTEAAAARYHCRVEDGSTLAELRVAMMLSDGDTQDVFQLRLIP